MCVCVCICLSMCEYMCAHTYIYICVCVRVCVCVYVYICVCFRIHIERQQTQSINIAKHHLRPTSINININIQPWCLGTKHPSQITAVVRQFRLMFVCLFSCSGRIPGCRLFSTASMLEWLRISSPTTHRGAVRKDGAEIF